MRITVASHQSADGARRTDDGIVLSLTSITRPALAFAGRLYPLNEGIARLSNGEVARHLIGRESFEVTTRLRNGARIRVLNDYVGRAALTFGDLDRPVTSALMAVLRPGDCVLDVGANVGIVSLFAAKAVGPTGSVHAFEPQPPIAALLRKSQRMNGLDQMRIHQVALSDHDGEMILRVPEDNRGAASLDSSQVAWAEHWEETAVQVRDATGYLDSLDLPPIRAMKVDIEGHEETFFRAAAEYLTRNPPAIIVFEEHEALPERAPTVTLLSKLGYEVHGLLKRRLRVHARPLSSVGSAFHKDLVGIHRGASYDSIRRALRASTT